MQSVHWKRLPRSPPSNPKLNCVKNSAKNPHWWRASTQFAHSTNPTLANATLIAGYVGIRHLDGRLEQQAEATATSKLVFQRVTRRGESKILHECEVRCDYALERGVPYPGMPYCTTAELQQIALNSATAHEATLRKKERREDIAVECEYLAQPLWEMRGAFRQCELGPLPVQRHPGQRCLRNRFGLVRKTDDAIEF